MFCETILFLCFTPKLMKQMKHVKQNIHFPIFQPGKMKSLESVPTVPPFQPWNTWNTGTPRNSSVHVHTVNKMNIVNTVNRVNTVFKCSIGWTCWTV